jgi:diazepam-binding inhibitor (GABA receptor modulating acyl-CoA-binding protein)
MVASDTTLNAPSGNAAFDRAAEEVRNLSKKPTDDHLLKLYALFKQGTVGDINTDRPGFFDLKGKAKWDAWNQLKGISLFYLDVGKSKGDAQKDYIHFVEELKALFA